MTQISNQFLIGLLIVLIITATSCDESQIAYETREVAPSWDYRDTLQFEIQPSDSVQQYDLLLNLRNDLSYPFANLWLITELQYPEGKTVTDTLEYNMAAPDGTFLGSKRGNIIENKLWYRENIRFRESGTYLLKLRHAMRRQNNVNPVQSLDGVIDVGYSLEKKLGNGNKEK